MTGVAGVLGRIQELETAMRSFAPARSPSDSVTSSTVTAAPAAEQPSFASVLDSLTVQGASLDPLRTSGPTAAPGPATGIPAADAAAAPATSVSGDALVAEARKFLGVPYAWGGESMSGIDCSGLVQRALGALGVDMPRVAREQMKEGSAVASLAEARVGDLLVFDGGSHIAIYLGDGRMIDAPKPGDAVRERDVYETPTAIRRVLTDAATAAPVSSPVSASGQIDQLLASSAAQRSSLSLLLGAAA